MGNMNLNFRKFFLQLQSSIWETILHQFESYNFGQKDKLRALNLSFLINLLRHKQRDRTHCHPFDDLFSASMNFFLYSLQPNLCHFIVLSNRCRHCRLHFSWIHAAHGDADPTLRPTATLLFQLQHRFVIL